MPCVFTQFALGSLSQLIIRLLIIFDQVRTA